jgi:hypothetical protein
MTHTIHQAFITAFGAEHHELRRLVHLLHEAIGDERPWSPEAAKAAVDVLAELATHLDHHFAQEENGGYLEEALTLAPRFTSQAAELLRQHPAILEKVGVLRKTANLSLRQSDAWMRLRSEVTDLIRDLIAHERAENQIVQQAFNTGFDD